MALPAPFPDTQILSCGSYTWHRDSRCVLLLPLSRSNEAFPELVLCPLLGVLPGTICAYLDHMEKGCFLYKHKGAPLHQPGDRAFQLLPVIHSGLFFASAGYTEVLDSVRKNRTNPGSYWLFHSVNIEVLWEDAQGSISDVCRSGMWGYKVSEFPALVQRVSPELQALKYVVHDFVTLKDPLDYLLFDGFFLSRQTSFG